MTKEEVKEAVTGFKKDYLKIINKSIDDEGRVSPALTILHKEKDKERTTVDHMLLPSEIMKYIMNQEKFSKILPDVLQEFIDMGKNPICVAWSAEVYVRKAIADLDDNGKVIIPSNNEIREIPKEEAIVIYYESEYESSVDCYIVKKQGQKVNSKGELVDDVTLEAFEEMNSNEGNLQVVGKYANVFSKLKK